MWTGAFSCNALHTMALLDLCSCFLFDSKHSVFHECFIVGFGLVDGVALNFCSTVATSCRRNDCCGECNGMNFLRS